MANEYLGTGNDDGVLFGRSTTDKIGFYGLTTPIVQPTGAAAVATTAITAVATTAATSSSPFGYASGQANGIVTAVNSLITRVAANTSLLNTVRANLVALNLQSSS